ncbi:MAG: metallophosphoesterase [Opitutae bacterium]|nr:metallophosphoesterase [Opitutae bacterium]
MRVLIVGDVHGRHRELAASLAQAQTDYRIAAAIQVGDFGFYKPLFSGAARIRYPVPLHVIDGNHEDHAWLRRALLTGAARAWRLELNLHYQSRPSLITLGASRIGFLGGALHADRPQKHNWLSGFPNYILRRQREQAVTLFNRERPELIVTHSCPTRLGIGMRAAAELRPSVAEHILAAGFDPGPEHDCGEVELSRLWGELTYRPRAWVFGHFHRAHEATVEGTRFIGLSDDLTSPDRTWVIWDTEEKLLLRCPVDPSRAG